MFGNLVVGFVCVCVFVCSSCGVLVWCVCCVMCVFVGC